MLFMHLKIRYEKDDLPCSGEWDQSFHAARNRWSGQTLSGTGNLTQAVVCAYKLAVPATCRS